MLQYAADTSGILGDIESAKLFLKEVEVFGHCSGLVLNKNKTEGMWIGASSGNKSKPLGISWPDEPLRLLGVYFSYGEKNTMMQISKAKLRNVKKSSTFGNLGI